MAEPHIDIRDPVESVQQDLVDERPGEPVAARPAELPGSEGDLGNDLPEAFTTRILWLGMACGSTLSTSPIACIVRSASSSMPIAHGW